MASSQSSGDTSGFTPARRRQIRGSACDDCRKRKARCDGVRPVCGPCDRNDVPCHYETFEGETRKAARSRRTENLQLENKKLRLENDELRRRAGFDMSSGADTLVSSNVSSASSPTDLASSLHTMDQAALPSWFTSTEHELVLSHSNSYASQQLPDHATLVSLHAKRIRRMLGDVHFASAKNRPGKEKAVHEVEGRGGSPQRYNHLQHHELSWQRPQSGSAPTHHDPRLVNIDVGAWCSVAMPDDMAGKLIGFYLEMDHAVLGHFDAELFVEDLTQLRMDFCSSLLVNSLLLWACHGYSAFDQRALMLKSALFTETTRLWNQHRGVASVLTLAAGVFLKMACFCNGDEQLGSSVMIDVYEMAHRLDLFGTMDARPGYADGNNASETKWPRAYAHAAWGVFNFVTLNAFSYGKPLMRLTPKFVIPGDTDTWHLPDYMGTTFTRLCELWLIVNQVALLYHAEPRDKSICERMTLDFAQGTYGRLLEWADAHGPLVRNWAGDSHHQCYLHTVFHVAVLDIFRPFLGRSLSLQSFGEHQYTPESIFKASLHQLNYQVLIYPIIHPSATFIFWFRSLVQSANAAITTLQDPHSQQMFLVCLLALHDLSPCFPIMSTALGGLLSIVTKRGDIDHKTARHLHDRLCRHKELSEWLSKASGAFVIDLNASMQELVPLSAGQLAESFESIMLGEISE